MSSEGSTSSPFREVIEVLARDDSVALAELRARQPAAVAAVGAALRARMAEGRAAPESLPSRIGPYRIIGLLGRGGMGDVYQAQDEQGAVVALKVIRWDRAGEPQVRRRFEKEQAVARALQHPNILSALDVGEHEGVLYYTMRFIEGARTLESLIEEGQREPGRAAGLVARCAGAIGWLHDRGLIHRDLKPGNVLVSPAGEPFIIDFGLAKDLLQTDGAWLTATGDAMGTRGYCAPEQASGGEASAASDLYGLGAILYAAVTGALPVPPRAGESHASYLQRLRQEEPQPPHARDPAISPRLSAIALKCLEKRPQRRYRSARELQQELYRYTLGEPVRARLKGPGLRLLHRLLDQPAARLVAGALALLLGAALAIAVVAVVGQRRLSRQITHDLADLAERTAEAVGSSIQFWSGSLEQLSHDGRLTEALAAAEAATSRSEREATRARLQRTFEVIQADNLRQAQRWLLFDRRGEMLARTPVMAGAMGQSFEGRDYFRGALRHLSWEGRRAVHVSAGYVSRLDGSEVVDISVGVRDQRGQLLGVLAAGVTNDVDLGTRRMVGKSVTMVLLVPWDDSSRAERRAPPTQTHLVLVHPSLRRGDQPLPYDSSFLPAAVRGFASARCELELSFQDLPAPLVVSDYHDPVVAGGAGPALQAAFAPVGHTGMILILQREP
jgi:serine/threonine-protein kinase